MTVTTGGGRLASPATRAFRRDSKRAGTHGQLSRADRVALGKDAYLGGSDAFDQAIADFAETYADQNERDYTAFQSAVEDGRAQATTDI
jgi:hypothetical protein